MPICKIRVNIYLSLDEKDNIDIHTELFSSHCTASIERRAVVPHLEIEGQIVAAGSGAEEGVPLDEKSVERSVIT